MKSKILVTTDLSTASKAAIRFAIQLASQHSYHLVFVHVFEALVPTRWSAVKSGEYLAAQVASEQARLQKFVAGMISRAGSRKLSYECVALSGRYVADVVNAHAAKIRAAYICTATRGAGRLRRIIGTNTSAILASAPVPVFVVPKNYRSVPINHFLYASDLQDFGTEIKKVKAIAKELRSSITVMHHDHLVQTSRTKPAFERIAKRYASKGLEFFFKKFNWEDSLAMHLKKAERKFKPSLVVLFTKQRSSWYDRIFDPSESAGVSFDSRKPLLVYPKSSPARKR